MKKTRDYWIATNDETGKTIVIVPITNASDAFRAQTIANRHFKVKASDLHCIAGVKKGNKVEGRESLSQDVNVWMVWKGAK